MCVAIDRTFKMDDWDRMKIEYAKQNDQLSGELVSLMFTRVMEQASEERATRNGYNGIRNICIKASKGE